MNITFKEKEYELKYTFNSIKMMKNFDMSVLEKLESHPFMIIEVSEQLLFGAMNHDPKKKVSPATVQGYVEYLFEEGDLVELITDLSELLQESNFFKMLQKSKNK